MIDISDLCSSRVLSQSLEIMVSMGLYSLDFAAQKLSGWSHIDQALTGCTNMQLGLQVSAKEAHK